MTKVCSKARFLSAMRELTESEFEYYKALEENPERWKDVSSMSTIRVLVELASRGGTIWARDIFPIFKSRRFATTILYVESRGLVTRDYANGRSYWSITAKGRMELTRLMHVIEWINWRMEIRPQVSNPPPIPC